MSATPANTPSPAALDRTLARHPRPLGGDPTRRFDRPTFSLTDQVLNNQGSDGQTDAKHFLAQKRKPDWLRAKVPGGKGYVALRSLLRENRLHTVCEEAGCPNMGECWARGVATIMILGDTCTRSCGFCNVKTGRPMPADEDEPRRVAESLAAMGLRHVVITSVDRDDMPDGGAAIWAATIEQTHAACPDMSVEVLTPDFKGDRAAVDLVCAARPEIFNHNMETVRRMHPAVRPQARYERSLQVLRWAKDAGLITKTGIMVGIGERDDEILEVMDDIRERAEVDILTIGQYMQPTRNHLPIDRWVTPEQFDRYKEQGLARGFRVVESGPLVRSSYHADMQVEQLHSGEFRSMSEFNAMVDDARKSRNA